MIGRITRAKARKGPLSMSGWDANPSAMPAEESVIRKIEVRVSDADQTVLSKVVSSEYSAVRTSLISSLSSSEAMLGGIASSVAAVRFGFLPVTQAGYGLQIGFELRT